MSTFAQRLSEVIAEDSRSKSEIAKACGISEATLYNYKSGATYPRHPQVEGLCKGLGVTERWLTSGLGEKSAVKHEENIMKIKAENDFKSRRIVNGKDKRQLEDINLAINHIRDMNISSDEMKAIYLTLAEIRNEIESKVLFNGMTA